MSAYIMSDGSCGGRSSMKYAVGESRCAADRIPHRPRKRSVPSFLTPLHVLCLYLSHGACEAKSLSMCSAFLTVTDSSHT